MSGSSPSDRTGRLVRRVAPLARAQDLRRCHVELVAGDGAAAEAAIAFAATLLLRLDDFAPALHLVAPAARHRALPLLDDGPLADAIGAAHAGFSSLERFSATPATTPDLRIVFGGDRDGIPVTVAGWRVGVGVPPLPAAWHSPAAAAYAGVLAAAEVFQHLVAPHGARTRPFRGIVSLWDFAVGGADGPTHDGAVDLDDVAFAACGGVASATFATLALFPLSGRPLLVNPDTIDDDATNLNRHLTATVADIGAGKAALAARMLDTAGTAAVHRQQRWRTPQHPFELAVTSPDDDAVRRMVQLDLPRVVLSGGTSDDGLYTVSRHDFVHGACVGCIARADLVDRSPLAAAARRLGLRESDLAGHVERDESLPDDVIAQAAVDDTTRAVLAATPGRQLVERLCGTLRPALTGPALSAPMLAAAPGVLLAAETVKEVTATFGRTQPGTVTTTSILTGPHSRWRTSRSKRGGCECGDATYRDFYSERWGHGS